MAAKTSLHLTGRQTDKDRLPALLQSASRSAGAAEDLFLPAGYLQTRACFEVGACGAWCRRGRAAVRVGR
jgi:hypothetical protein